jgi:DNA replication protein DnaC
MVPQKKLQVIEEKIKRDCQCAGEGCSECKKKIARVRAYAKAELPMDYWFLSMKDFKGDQNFKKYVIDNVLADINRFYEEGQSLAFVGNLGIGKTYAAVAIMKTAIMSNFSARYIYMSDIIQKATESNSGIFEELTNVDFLTLDEYCDRYVFPSDKAEQLFGQTMERILRHRLQNRMPTIICSNTPDLKDVLAGDFSRAVDSLFSRYVKVVYVSGKDFRKSGGKE